jgi:dihydrodipicolinate synthase/N-acetylneuraminate lyase
VVVGSGSNCTATQIEKSIEYQNMGADALLLIAPYYNKANPEGMYRHFVETADKVDIPCLLYNVPGRTGCSIPVSVVERLAKHPKIVGIKEASGDLSYAAKIAAHCVGPDFALYSGNDDVILPVMSLGGISTWQEAIEFIMAGATVIQVGTATFMRPEKALDIIDGMERYCEENGIQNLSEIRGIV